MAYSHALHWNGSTGSATKGGGRTYAAVYRVTTDNALDGAQKVLDYFRDNSDLPWIGSDYRYGNDVDATAFVSAIDPQRDPNSAIVWIVSVRFEPISTEHQTLPDKNGNPSDDPLEWPGEVTVSLQYYNVPAERVRYLGTYVLRPDGTEEDIDDIPGSSKGQIGPVRNSAGEEMMSNFVEERVRIILRISQYATDYPAALSDELQNTVNTETVTPRLPKTDPTFSTRYGAGVTPFPMAPYTSRCPGISGAFLRVNLGWVWKLSVELQYDKRTWIESVPDRGYSTISAVGKPKGQPVGAAGYIPGGANSWSAEELEANKKAGVANLQAIVDGLGMPVREPVPLNGRGEQIENPKVVGVVFNRYLPFRTANHKKLFKPIGPFDN